MPAGTVVSSGSLVSPGGQQGIPGPTGAGGPTVVSSDLGNTAVLGSDSRIYVPDTTPKITSVRLRSFNAIGNPTFEVDQRNAGNLITATVSSWAADRWAFSMGATGAGITIGEYAAGGQINVPGTSFCITSKSVLAQVSTQKATLGASDIIYFIQNVEGPLFRELSNDYHSISILVNCSQPVKFTLGLRDGGATKTLVKLCTVPVANTWTLLTFPNLPGWSASGSYGLNPATLGYSLFLTLACGSSFMAPAADTWQNGNFIGAPGMDNFASFPVNTTIYIAFVQHESGPSCTTLIDKPWIQNYDECLRYYTKSYEYPNVPGAVTGSGRLGYNVSATFTQYLIFSEDFPKHMAKQPTITVYSDVTGAVGNCRDQSVSADKAVSGITVSSKRFHQFQLPAATTSNALITFHYTADTGW